jgi:hypothetical protein
LSNWLYLQFSNNFQFCYYKRKDLIALHLPPDTGDCIASSGEILYCLSAIHRLLLNFFISHVVGVETVAWSPFSWNLEISLSSWLISLLIMLLLKYCFIFFVVISFSWNISRCQTVSICVLHAQPSFWFFAQSNFHIEIFQKQFCSGLFKLE